MSDPEEKSTTELVDLLHGRKKGIDAWRLRRQIARDPERSREWNDLQRLQNELNGLAQSETVRPTPIWPTPLSISGSTFTFGGITMKRRTVFAVCGFLLFALTGTVAARQFLDFTPSFAFSRPNGPLWQIRTTFVGHVQVLDADAKLIGIGGSDSGGTTEDVVHVAVGDHRPVDISGLGRHEIRAESGELLGYIELVALTEQDKAEAEARAERSFAMIERMYQPDTVTSSEYPGSSGTESLPGLVAGFSVSSGISWKVIGYATVKAEDRTERVPLHMVGESAEQLAAMNLKPELVKATQFLAKLAPARNKKPILYWTLAEKTNGEYRLSNQKWLAVRQQGTFTGFGRHIVKDKNGKTVLTLDVSPLGPKTP